MKRNLLFNHMPDHKLDERMDAVSSMSIPELEHAHAALDGFASKTYADLSLLRAYREEMRSRNHSISIPSKVCNSNKHGPKDPNA